MKQRQKWKGDTFRGNSEEELAHSLGRRENSEISLGTDSCSEPKKFLRVGETEKTHQGGRFDLSIAKNSLL